MSDHFSIPKRKREYNRNLFARVAPVYDRVTPLLSLFQDKKWKRRLVDSLETRREPVILDLACGTGDIAILLARRFPRGRIVGADLSAPMLALAPSALHRVRGDMNNLPFSSCSADTVTGGYALRNAPDLARTLDEVFRVLRPGGQAAFLDFSRSPSPIIDAMHHRVLWLWGSLWGWLFHRDPAVYAYIAASLMHFPDRRSLEKLIAEAGFDGIVTTTFFLGVIAIVTFRKPRLIPPRAKGSRESRVLRRRRPSGTRILPPSSPS